MCSKKQKINTRDSNMREYFEDVDSEIRLLMEKLKTGVAINGNELILLKRNLQKTKKTLQAIKKK